MRLDQTSEYECLILYNSRDKIALVFVPLPKGEWKLANSDYLAVHKFIHPAYLA